MAFSPADSRILGSLFSDPVLAECFSDETFARRMLEVEAALARAQADARMIPDASALAIAEAAGSMTIDLDDLARGYEREGVPVVALVGQLKRAVGPAAAYVHLGATTQDIVDTALILQLRQALAYVEQRLKAVTGELVRLTRIHRATLMAGRTHSQQALPITFGLKTAGWLAPLLRHFERLDEVRPRLLRLQLGGAAGTLASLGAEGPAVGSAMARILGLALPPMPWHTQRDALVELAGWLSLVSGSLGKIAQDVILLAQSEVAEVRESDDPTLGGSSTMPQKNNPIRSEVVIAVARDNATALSAMHHAQIQEHERATHGWQLEWLTLPGMFASTAAALNQTHFVCKHLAVDVDRMRRNVEASNGLMLAEAARLALTPLVGAEAAGRLLKQAVVAVSAEGRHLVDVLRSLTDAPADWTRLRDESAYLGATEAFIDSVLQQAERVA